MKPEFFYDTYAIIAFLQGDKRYLTLFTNSRGVTTFGNLLETYYITLREHGPTEARTALEFAAPFLMAPEIDDVTTSMAFRLAHRRKNLSYTDCLGYAVAKRLGIPFLTGDREFKGLPNVRFIPTTI